MPAMIEMIKHGVADALRIDKVTLTLHIKSADGQASVLDAMNKLVQLGHASVANLKHYYHSIWVTLDHYGERTFLVQAGQKWQNARFLKVEFNPSTTLMGEVHTIINFVVPGGHSALIAQGNLRRVDLAVDVHGVQPAQLLVAHGGFQLSKLFAESGQVTGYKIGSNESSRCFVVYDKRLQLKKENANTKWKAPIPDHPLTRIEARIRADFPASKLATIANPFSKLMIADFGSIAADDDDTKLFVMAALGAGAQTVLSSVSAPRRKLLKERLSKAVPTWWMPTNVWQAWPDEANKVLTPPPAAYDLSLHKKVQPAVEAQLAH